MNSKAHQMPRVTRSRAQTTLDSTANLWAAALTNDPLVVRLSNRTEVFNLRNKLYSWRANQRRAAAAHTGFHTTPYDELQISYRQELAPNLTPTGRWFLQLGRSNFISFELLEGPGLSGLSTSSNGDHNVNNESPDQPAGGCPDTPVADQAPAQPEAPDGQENQEDEVEGAGDEADTEADA